MGKPRQDQRIRGEVTDWLEAAVIGLDLCPFAGPVHRAGRIRWAVSPARDAEHAVRDALEEADRLIRSTPDEVATTVVIIPWALADFDEFLDAAETLTSLLDEAGAGPLVQVATFHPSYRFEGPPADDPSHYTNRSPHPILHLLRQEDVERAVLTHPDTAGIPDRNIERLRQLGERAVRSLWRRWTESR